MIKKKLKNFINNLFQDHFDKKLILKAKILSTLNNKKKIIKDFSDIEYKVFSQWGEDGIIDWLTSKIKNIPNNFIEIGTEDYEVSNTRYLLQNQNWTGYIIESDKNAVNKIKKSNILWKYNLNVINAFVNSSNINTILKKFNIPKKIGLLSIDIDSTDYWVLQNLKYINPVIIVCEFNPLFGLKESCSVPDKKKFIRNNEHYSNLYYGASIKAYQQLLRKKNYIFLGTNSAGNNAFFIKKKFSKNIGNSILYKKKFISQFRESRNKSNKLTYLKKTYSLKLIKNKLIFDFKRKKIKKISEMNI